MPKMLLFYHFDLKLRSILGCLLASRGCLCLLIALLPQTATLLELIWTSSFLIYNVQPGYMVLIWVLVMRIATEEYTCWVWPEAIPVFYQYQSGAGLGAITDTYLLDTHTTIRFIPVRYEAKNQPWNLIPERDWYESFKKVPSTSSCQGWRRTKKTRLRLQGPVLWYAQKSIPVQTSTLSWTQHASESDLLQSLLLFCLRLKLFQMGQCGWGFHQAHYCTRSFCVCCSSYCSTINILIGV
jgi:hypothetical protein